MDNFCILWKKRTFIRNVIASCNTRILEKCTALICWSFGGWGTRIWITDVNKVDDNDNVESGSRNISKKV